MFLSPGISRLLKFRMSEGTFPKVILGPFLFWKLRNLLGDHCWIPVMAIHKVNLFIMKKCYGTSYGLYIEQDWPVIYSLKVFFSNISHVFSLLPWAKGFKNLFGNKANKLGKYAISYPQYSHAHSASAQLLFLSWWFVPWFEPSAACFK